MVRSLDIRREIRVSVLLLDVKESELRWLEDWISIPLGSHPLDALRARPTGSLLTCT